MVKAVLFPPSHASTLRNLLQQFGDRPQELDRLRANIEPIRMIVEHVADVEAVYCAVVAH